jgi:antitoxin ParD1/3/4
MSDLDPVLKARADLLEDVRCKVEIAVAELDRGEGIDLDMVMEQLQQKLRSAKEGV